MSSRKSSRRSASSTRQPRETRHRTSRDSSTEPVIMTSSREKTSRRTAVENEVKVTDNDLDMTCSSSSSDDSRPTSAASQIDVDVPSGHSGAEVIVKGNNVRKIRVKFPSLPNYAGDGLPMIRHCSYSRPGSRMTRQSSSGSTVRSHSLSRMAECVCDEHLPYPQEETGELPGNCASGAEGGQMYRVPHPPSQPPTNSSTVSLHSMRDEHRAAKIRQDVMNGLKYFEDESQDLARMNDLLQQQLKVAEGYNREMQEKVGELEEQIMDSEKAQIKLTSENEELKIKQDELENENSRLQLSAVEHWNGKNYAEEQYFEMKLLKNEEITTLTAQLKNKSEQIEEQVKVIEDFRARTSESAERSNNNLRLELMAKVQQLQEDLARSRSDNATMVTENSQLHQETMSLKEKLSQVRTDLDLEFDRFNTLKKEFENLKDRPVGGVKSRRNSLGGTWPKEAPSHPAVIDLSLPVQKEGTTAPPSHPVAAKRFKTLKYNNLKVPGVDNKSDSCESLPPVGKSQK